MDNSALLMAVRDGDVRTCKMLLEQGVNVNSGQALILASARKHKEIVKLLIEHGADVRAPRVRQQGNLAGVPSSMDLISDEQLGEWIADNIWVMPVNDVLFDLVYPYDTALECALYLSKDNDIMDMLEEAGARRHGIWECQSHEMLGWHGWVYDEGAIVGMDLCEKIVSELRRIRKDLGILNKDNIIITIDGDKTKVAGLIECRDVLRVMGKAIIVDSFEEGVKTEKFQVDGVGISVLLDKVNPEDELKKEIKRLYDKGELDKDIDRRNKKVEKLKKDIDAISNKLDNKVFVERAPKEVVEKEKKKLAEMNAELEKEEWNFVCYCVERGKLVRCEN